MKRNIQGMTLMEVLIVVTIFMLIAAVAILLFNPIQQMARARDTKRKNDLNELRKVMESWYSDKNCYPKKSEVCFDNVSPSACDICTSHSGSPSLSNYTTSTLCDPTSPQADYLYEAQGNADCPSGFAIYTKLSATYMKENDIYNCSPLHGCGPAGGPYKYDYLVGSPNMTVVVSNNYFCSYPRGNGQMGCKQCYSYDSCMQEKNRHTCNELYSTYADCCAVNSCN